jgi:hypothetical protein
VRPGVRYTASNSAIWRLVRSGLPDRTYPTSVFIQELRIEIGTGVEPCS